MIYFCVITVILALMNCYSLRLASTVMSLLSVTKVFAVFFIIVVGIISMIRIRTFPSSFTHPFQTVPEHKTDVSSIGLSLYNVLWAYDGW